MATCRSGCRTTATWSASGTSGSENSESRHDSPRPALAGVATDDADIEGLAPAVLRLPSQPYPAAIPCRFSAPCLRGLPHAPFKIRVCRTDKWLHGPSGIFPGTRDDRSAAAAPAHGIARTGTRAEHDRRHRRLRDI